MASNDVDGNESAVVAKRATMEVKVRILSTETRSQWLAVLLSLNRSYLYLGHSSRRNGIFPVAENIFSFYHAEVFVLNSKSPH